MPKLQLTPFVLCSSQDKQIEFYGDRLGIACSFRPDNYAHLRLCTVAIRLQECPSRPDGCP